MIYIELRKTEKTFVNYRLYIFLLGSIFSFSISGQDRASSFILRGKIQVETSGEPVAFAHIYNESRKFGLISDMSGHFVTKVKYGDTLAVTAIGYYGKVHIVSSPLDSIIELKPMVYEIEEVSVKVPLDYTRFKKAFLDVELDKEKLSFADELPKYNPYQKIMSANSDEGPGFSISSPMSSLYSKYSKREISKWKVLYLQQQQLKQPAVDKKYNRELVAEITGFSDYALTHFMGWCNFSFNYLYQATPLQIVEAIHLKYVEYMNCCYEEGAESPLK